MIRMDVLTERLDATGAVIFEYVGMTAMLAEGQVTRERYWFERPGARIAVDLRDRDGMRRVPNVKEVAELLSSRVAGRSEMPNNLATQ
jgi:hypothetical protein